MAQPSFLRTAFAQLDQLTRKHGQGLPSASPSTKRRCRASTDTGLRSLLAQLAPTGGIATPASQRNEQYIASKQLLAEFEELNTSAGAKVALPEKFVDIIKVFFPGGVLQAGPAPTGVAAVDDLVSRALTNVAAHRAGGTFRRYRSKTIAFFAFAREHLPTWTSKEWLSSDGLVLAFLQQVVETTTSVGPVLAASAAVNFTAALHGVPSRPKVWEGVLRSAMRRTRRCPTKKSAALRYIHLRKLYKWAAPGCPTWKLWTVTALGLGFFTLGRFSDVARFQYRGVMWLLLDGTTVRGYLAPGVKVLGAFLFLAGRKNNQDGDVQWLPVSDPELLAILRRLMQAAPPGQRRGWMFRSLHKVGGHTHAHLLDYKVGGPEDQMAYKQFLKLMRSALRDSGAVPRADVAAFSTQCMRRGGDTALFNGGFSASERRDIGHWATPAVERSYLELELNQQLALIKGFKCV